MTIPPKRPTAQGPPEDEFAQNAIMALHRLAKQSTMYDSENQAQMRQLESLARAAGGYGRVTGQNLKINFAEKGVFVGKKLLRANRSIYEAAQELGTMLRPLGIDELAIGFDVPIDDLQKFQTALGDALRKTGASPTTVKYSRIRLRQARPKKRAIAEAREKNLTPEDAIIRTYATAVVVMRHFIEDLLAQKYELPTRVRRIAQKLAELSAVQTPTFLGVTALRNTKHDDAGRAVNAALLSLGILRQLTNDKRVLARVATAALLHDVGRVRVAGAGPTGEGRLGSSLPRLADFQIPELPDATAALACAMPGHSDSTTMVKVLLYEACHISARPHVPLLYGGLQAASVEAHVVSIAARFSRAIGDNQSDDAVDQVMSDMLATAEPGNDQTVMHLLLAALGLFPVGAMVELSDGHIAQVLSTPTEPQHFSQPTVRLTMNPTGQPITGQDKLHLSSPENQQLQIVRIVSMGEGGELATAATISSQTPATRTTDEDASSRELPMVEHGEQSHERPAAASHQRPAGEQGAVDAEAETSFFSGSPPEMQNASGLTLGALGSAISGAVASEEDALDIDLHMDASPAVPAVDLDPISDDDALSVSLDPAPIANPDTAPEAGLSPAPAPARAIAPPMPTKKTPSPPPPNPTGLDTKTPIAIAPPEPPPPSDKAPFAIAPPSKPPPAMQKQEPAGSSAPAAQPAPPKAPIAPPPRKAGPTGKTPIAIAPPPPRPPGSAQPAAQSAAETPRVPSQPPPPKNTPRGRLDTQDWLQENLKGLKPSAQGLLSKTPLPHLLVYAVDQNLSGTCLFVTPDGDTHIVVFHKGAPAKVRTSGTIAPLDRIVLELGLVEESTLHQTLSEVSSTGKLHGEILVAGGHLKEDQLEAALRRQLVRKVSYIARQPAETRFAYYAGVNLLKTYGGPELFACNPLAMIMTAIRLRPQAAEVEATMSRIGNHRLSMHADADTTALTLNDQEERVCELLRAQPMPLAELLRHRVAPERVVQVTVYALVITRCLALGGKSPLGDLNRQNRAAPRSSRPSAIPSSQPGQAPPSRGSDSGPVSVRPRPKAHATRQDVVTSRKGAAERKAASEAAKSRRIQALRDRNQARKTVKAEVTVKKTRILPRDVEGKPTVDQIDSILAHLDDMTFFEMLDVEIEATDDDIQSAYFKIAKVWHPDRLPEELQEKRADVAKIFARFNEANKALENKASRDKYVELVQSGGGTARDQEMVERVVDSALLFQKAEVLFKKGAVGHAIDMLRQAVMADPEQPEYRCLLAWAQAQRILERGVSEDDKVTAYKEQIEMLDKVLEKEANFERALHYRGQLLKRSGMSTKALRDFKAVVAINPSNIDAAREVRLAEKAGRGRDSDKGKEKSSGLFGGLFSGRGKEDGSS